MYINSENINLERRQMHFEFYENVSNSKQEAQLSIAVAEEPRRTVS